MLKKKDTCSPMPTAALVTHTHTHTTIKKSDILPFATT